MHTFSRHLGIRILAAGLSLAPTLLPAQDKPRPPAEKPRTSARYSSWSQDVSRRLFALCDRNRDDRLTFREVRQALRIGSGAGFRPYDLDRDGRLHQGEFDRLYRAKVASGRGLVIYGPAAAKAPPQPVQVSIRIRELFTTLDHDRGGNLTPTEWGSSANPLLQVLPDYFLRLDRNRDNRLNLRELKALEKLVPQLVRRERATPVINPNTLPRRYQKVDQDGDGMISQRELELLLKEIDPSLPRWTGTIFKRLDRNRNGRISPREIRLLKAKKP